MPDPTQIQMYAQMFSGVYLLISLGIIIYSVWLQKKETMSQNRRIIFLLEKLYIQSGGKDKDIKTDVKI